MRILVVCDSYLPASVFAAGFRSFGEIHSIDYLQLDADLVFEPGTESELAIREFEGALALFPKDAAATAALNKAKALK